MKRCRYESIVATIGAAMHQKDCLKVTASQHPEIPHGTLLSIYSQHFQYYTKQIHATHRRPEKMQEYYKQYLQASADQDGERQEGLLLCMANKALLSPTLFARIILEVFITERDTQPPNTVTKDLVSQWIKNPSEIPNSSLQQQVRMCILNDVNYGPFAENVKHSVGYEYEFLLQEKLQRLNIPFLDERALRLRGYDKTADFKLEVPISVEGYVLNWIESKASFGDENSHRKYLEEQFWSYQNRFGPGVVIYWFGFIEELNANREQGILLMDTFPCSESITMLKFE